MWKLKKAQIRSEFLDIHVSTCVNSSNTKSIYIVMLTSSFTQIESYLGVNVEAPLLFDDLNIDKHI